MHWYHYFSGFWAGMVLANFVPHFVKGISGDRFPSPFTRPMGRALSSPVVNVLWALFNLIVAYVLYRSGRVSTQDDLSLAIFFAGFAAFSIRLSISMAGKHKE